MSQDPEEKLKQLPYQRRHLQLLQRLQQVENDSKLNAAPTRTHSGNCTPRAGYHSNLSERAVKPPVFRSSTFEFATAEEGELFFKRAYNLKGNDGQAPGLVYSRVNNPNTEIFEDKMVAAERGSNYASAFPSGMSAITTAIMALVPKGGHILFTNPVYGGTYFFFKHICPDRLDITTTPCNTSNNTILEQAILSCSRLDALYLETPANPTLAVTDIALAVRLVKAKNPECIVVVDNTFLGPVYQAPFLHGAHVVLYSATKFIGGHSDLLAGVVLTQDATLIQKINGYRTILGPVVSPDVTWLLTRSLETVWLRMEKQAEKACEIARALVTHPHVSRVLFPGLFSDENSDNNNNNNSVWKRQCSGTGSMITIIVRPNTRQAAYTVLNGLDIAHLAVSLGSTETLVQHPRSMTHSDMSEEDLDACGIAEGMLRISVGLENAQDIIHDITSALDLLLLRDDDNNQHDKTTTE